MVGAIRASAVGMTLDLSKQELALVRTHLGREIAHVENELVHTDKFELQHELAAELAKLRAVAEKIDAQLTPERAAPAH